MTIEATEVLNTLMDLVLADTYIPTIGKFRVMIDTSMTADSAEEKGLLTAEEAASIKNRAHTTASQLLP